MASTTRDVVAELDGRNGARPGVPWARLGFALAGLVLVIGWLLPLDRYLTPRNGAGYTLGIVGGSLMIALLIYPLRKRVPALAFAGSTKTLFSVHMMFGIVGPLCILYHSNYRLGAANSNVALVCMIVVASSGIIGRYLYARIHHGLHGRLASLAELRAEAKRLQTETSGPARVLPKLAGQLAAAEQGIAKGLPLVPTPLVAVVAYRIARMRLRKEIRNGLRRAVAAELLPREHVVAFEMATNRYVERRLGAARRVAEFNGCARLFALWHVLHIPLFFMLLIAGIVHVVAVHVY